VVVDSVTSARAVPRTGAWLAFVAAVVGLGEPRRPPPAPQVLRVVDVQTGRPISGAIVTVEGSEALTDREGRTAVAAGPRAHVAVRAPGYRRAEVPRPAASPSTTNVGLEAFSPKALYLSLYGIGSPPLRDPALTLIDATELNAVVFDVKGDRGYVAYRSQVALAQAIGAQRVITIPDLPALVAGLRGRGIYTIARIVVFKDDLLAAGRPELAVRRRDGSIFRDREGLAWVSPFSSEVRDYNIAIATEAAAAGVDEIQFDYARLPDAPSLLFPGVDRRADRAGAITDLLREARAQLAAWNVFVAIDVFGYVCWNEHDTGIGQQLEDLVGVADYVSPMLYPSSFQAGIPGYRHPVQHPYQIVNLSLGRARERTDADPVRFRPWLQAFRDYAFGGRPFAGNEIRAQIKAAEDFGSNGWMLWNPANRYSAEGLAPEPSPR
jgi:hypothetical protein